MTVLLIPEINIVECMKNGETTLPVKLSSTRSFMTFTVHLFVRGLSVRLIIGTSSYGVGKNICIKMTKKMVTSVGKSAAV